MRRMIIQGLLACLLALFPVMTIAQTLTKYEYWFDDDFAGRKSGTLSGSYKVLTLGIDTYFMPQGIHKFSFRVRQSDGYYSAVTSSLFLKRITSETTALEYWFDDNIDQRESISISDGPEEQQLTLDLRNNTLYPPGYHTLNMRATVAGQGVSTICSAGVLKIAAGKVSTLEYWVDDDRAGVRTLDAHTAEGGYVFTSDLDLSNVALGYHNLHMRARSSSGRTASAVTTAGFLKLQAGVANKLEYWIDKRTTVHALSGEAIDNGYIFLSNLNLGNLAPGQHRLYFRSRSVNGKTASAVTMVPVIVKLDYGPYNEAYSQPTNAKVTNYSVAVDNQAPTNYEVRTPKYEVRQPHVLDATNLSAGNHTVKLKFWNSLHAGVSTEKTFKVVIPEEPMVTLAAQQQGGLVKLQFNSVPNEIAHAIRRVDPNGTVNKLHRETSCIYPESYAYTDNPGAAGTYTYYVDMNCYDWTGTFKPLKSNEVTVTISNVQTEEEAVEQYGNIVGKIVCDKNTPTSGLSVKFVEDGVTVPVQGTVFSRTQVAKGTTLTMKVLGDNTHVYQSDPLTVKAGNNDVVITGTYKEEFQPDNLRNDLEISQLQLTSQQNELHLKMYLKNLYQERPWRGIIRVKAIDKKKAEATGQYIAELDLYTPNMYVGTANNFSIGGGDSKYVELDISGLAVNKSTDYYFYFESIGKFDDTRTGNVLKPIAANSHSDVNSNPIIRTVNPRPVPQQEYTKWNNQAKEDFAYLMLGANSVIPGIDGIYGDMDPIAREVMNAIGMTNPVLASQTIAGWVSNKSGLQALNDQNLKLVKDAAKKGFEMVRDDVKKRIVKKFWSSLAKVIGDEVEDVKPLIKFIVNSYKDRNKPAFDHCISCMSVLYGALAEYPGPVSNSMKAYMAVGKSLVEAANEILEIQNSKYIGERLIANRKNTNPDDDRVNTAVDFKLIVNDKKKNKPIDFTKDKYHEQISSVSICMLRSPTADPTVFSFNLKPCEDGEMLETVQTENISYTGQTLYYMDVAHALYMEIHWADTERVTYIPLLRSDDGVEIKVNGTHVANLDGDYDKEDVITYIVTLTTATGKDNMADEIYLGNNSERQ